MGGLSPAPAGRYREALGAGAFVGNLGIDERLVGAVGDAHRYLLALAEVALDHLLAGRVEPGDAERTGQRAGAAADAAVFVDQHQGGERVAGEGPGEAGAETGGG